MPSFGRIGKRNGVGWGLGATEDRHDEQTDRNRRTSMSVPKCLAIRAMSSLGSWCHSAIEVRGEEDERNQTRESILQLSFFNIRNSHAIGLDRPKNCSLKMGWTGPIRWPDFTLNKRWTH